MANPNLLREQGCAQRQISVAQRRISGARENPESVTALKSMEVALDEHALPPDVSRALAAVRSARDALQPDDPRRAAVEEFLAE